MDRHEFEISQEKINKDLAYLETKSAKRDLWITILIMAACIIMRIYVLGNDSSSDFVEKHPNYAMRIYIMDGIHIVIFFICLIIALPANLMCLQRNESVVSTRKELTDFLEKNWKDIAYEEFHGKLIEKSNFIYLNT